jgi:hypothetical protein
VTLRQPTRVRATLPRWLAGMAVLAVLGLGTLLVAFYRVPWGGSFDESAAGPVSEWVGDLFTALGIVGLIYQVSQLRLSRVDETTREINSLYISISTKAWRRNAVIDGKLVYVYLQNDGERKAMDVEISAPLKNGQAMPEAWVIKKMSHFSLPPSMTEPICVLLFHVPDKEGNTILDATGEPNVIINWTDPWKRRVQMTNNMPSSIIERNA